MAYQKYYHIRIWRSVDVMNRNINQIV